MSADHLERCERARLSLEGLSVGDALGERLYVQSPAIQSIIAKRVLTAAPWPFTDDTQMALSIFETLRRFGEIQQDELAWSFAVNYEWSRGYGPATHKLLEQIRDGAAWRTAARALFQGQGSWGNGSAMRVAPVGAYFAEDPTRAAREAILSAEVTHAHPEALAGTAAVAVAASRAWQLRGVPAPSRAEFIESVLPFVPASTVRTRIETARDLPAGCTVREVVETVGNGEDVSAEDTVPLCALVRGRAIVQLRGGALADRQRPGGPGHDVRDGGRHRGDAWG